MAIPKDNLLYPVLLTGVGTKGSGFYLNTEKAAYLVTAKHVLFKNGLALYGATIELTSLGSDHISKVVLRIEDCQALIGSGDCRKHTRADVAIIRVGHFQEPSVVGEPTGVGSRRLRQTNGIARGQQPDGVGPLGLPVGTARRLADVEISNDVLLFSYPTSLGGKGTHLDGTRPLLRSGIIAGKTEDGRIVLDCPVYHGNSGGLVIEIEEALGQTKYYGIGIAVEMVPFVEELWSKQFQTKMGDRIENSGYSLVEPIDRVLDLIAEFETVG